MMHRKLRILSNSAKFSAGWPLLPEYFSATLASISSTYRLAALPFCKTFWHLKICLKQWCNFGLKSAKLEAPKIEMPKALNGRVWNAEGALLPSRLGGLRQWSNSWRGHKIWHAIGIWSWYQRLDLGLIRLRLSAQNFSASRLGLGLLRVVSRDVLCGVRAVRRSVGLVKALSYDSPPRPSRRRAIQTNLP